MKTEIKSKVCTKCGEEKVLEEFSKRKDSKDGRRAQCKACGSSVKKAYREANKEELAARKKAYYEANRERVNARNKAYYEANKEKEIARSKAYREANREKIAARQKIYRKKRYAEDPIYKTIKALRAQTSRLGDYKSKSTIEIVGISPQEFWERNGSPSVEELEDLHIDHIVPLSWFDLSNEDHVRVSSHWTNFQYLSEEDNLIKNNNYAGRPDAILGYKDDFDIEKHVQDMIEFINATK